MSDAEHRKCVSMSSRNTRQEVVQALWTCWAGGVRLRRVGSILAVNLHRVLLQRSTAAWPLTQPVLTAGQVTGSGVCPWLPWAFPPGPHTRLQLRCWAGLWARQGSSGERHASELGVVSCNQSPLSVGRPAGLSLLPQPPVACSSLLSKRLVSFSQPGSMSPRRLTEHAHIHPGYPPTHLTHKGRGDSPRA